MLAILLCLSGVFSAAPALRSPNSTIVLQVFEGVLDGFLGKDAPNIKKCVGDGEEVIVHVETAIKDFKMGTFDGFRQGIAEIGFALDNLADGMKACNASKTDIQKLLDVIHQFKDPWSFIVIVGQRILINGKDIYEHIVLAIEDYHVQKFFPFGQQIGYIITDLIPDPKMNQLAIKGPEVVLIFEGVLDGFLGADAPSVKACVNDAEAIVAHFVAAVKLFEQHTFESIRQGLAELSAALQYLDQAMVACKAAPGDIQKIVNVIKQFKSPWQFIFTIGKNLLVNGKEIYAEIVQAVADWHRPDYFGFGQQIGLIISKLLPQPTSFRDVHFINNKYPQLE